MKDIGELGKIPMHSYGADRPVVPVQTVYK
jgi:hypothetical protein